MERLTRGGLSAFMHTAHPTHSIENAPETGGISNRNQRGARLGVYLLVPERVVEGGQGCWTLPPRLEGLVHRAERVPIERVLRRRERGSVVRGYRLDDPLLAAVGDAETEPCVGSVRFNGNCPLKRCHGFDFLPIAGALHSERGQSCRGTARVICLLQVVHACPSSRFDGPGSYSVQPIRPELARSLLSRRNGV